MVELSAKVVSCLRLHMLHLHHTPRKLAACTCCCSASTSLTALGQLSGCAHLLLSPDALVRTHVLPEGAGTSRNAFMCCLTICRACRHGDRCSRIHNKPTISQTLLLQNMYQNPMMSMAPGPDGLPPQMDPRASQEHFEVGACLSGLRYIITA